MPNDTEQPPKKKNHRALRKLVKTVALAGAVFAAEKYIESRKNKKTS